MLFHSIDFLLFFPIVVILYFVIPKKIRMFWLLAASYYFYMCWNPVYSLLMLFSTIITYFSGLCISRATTQKQKKLFVAGSFVLNLAILFFYKYFQFAVDSIMAVLGVFNISLQPPKLNVLLPVGISFYTFQALSYTMDVYHEELPVEKNFFRYALFVSFFPQLVAGPIERSKNLLTQLEKPNSFSFENMRSGLLMMLWGFFQKLVIADRAAIFVDYVYNNFQGYVGYPLVIATLLFAIQIYCDFGGYSCIAIGAAQVLGIQLMQNFRQPYFATSIGDFWRRWHISLSTWFRDYLYFPMGGSRCGVVRRNWNLMVTFIVSGAWHGANWTYIIWGTLNGCFQIIERSLKNLPRRLQHLIHVEDCHRRSFSRRFLKTVTTFFLINLTWVFFRAETVADAMDILHRIFSVNNLWIFTDGTLFRLGLDAIEFCTLIAAIAVLFVVDLSHEKGLKLRETLYKQELWFRWLVYFAALFAVLILGIYGEQYNASAFVYFQF